MVDAPTPLFTIHLVHDGEGDVSLCGERARERMRKGERELVKGERELVDGRGRPFYFVWTDDAEKARFVTCDMCKREQRKRVPAVLVVAEGSG